MFFYQIYGLKIKSNIPFPQLLEWDSQTSSEAECDITICLSDEHTLDKKFAEVIEREGNYSFTENGVWFRNQEGDFLIETVDDKSLMLCERFGDTDESVVRSFFMGNCIAVVMTQRKKIVLHGSSLLMDGRTVLVCGGSGSGKSTTSMALIDSGAGLMADDISVIDIDPADGVAYAYPAFPEQKLCRDAADKRGIDLNELTYINEDSDKFSYLRKDIFVNERRKVDTLIIIGRSLQASGEGFVNGVRIREITGADKVNAITKNFFLEWLYGKGLELKPAEMMKCFALAGQIRIIEVTRAMETDTRKEILDRILELLRA